MKSKFKATILIITIIMTNFSCLRKSENTILNNEISGDSLKNKELTVKDNRILQHIDFDTKKFIRLTNSLFSSLNGRKINMELEGDTSLETNCRRNHYYIFSEKGNKLWSFGFSIFTYTDTVKLNQDFDNIRKDANDTEITDNTPALSYSNDNVYKSKDQIVWINTGCNFSFNNHLKIKSNVLESLRMSLITDSVVCHCGEFGSGDYGTPQISKKE